MINLDTGKYMVQKNDKQCISSHYEDAFGSWSISLIYQWPLKIAFFLLTISGKSWEMAPNKTPEEKQMVLHKIVFTSDAILSQFTPMPYLKSVDAFKVFNPGRFGFHLLTFVGKTRTRKLMCAMCIVHVHVTLSVCFWFASTNTTTMKNTHPLDVPENVLGSLLKFDL